MTRIVLRTYLTSAAGYRRHIADGTACDDLKDALLALHLPHFNWVTEIATVDSYNHSSAAMRRITDTPLSTRLPPAKTATGSLALHLPGLLCLRRTSMRRRMRQEELDFIIGR